MKKHISIPIFIPELACPFQCVFCNQKKITGKEKIPSPAEIREKIDLYLASSNQSETEIEIAYFGGSFTGLEPELIREYLEIAAPYISAGRVSGVRISTRPDYISLEILDLLKRYGVKIIELGAQSFDEEVLKRSGRGHTADDTRYASELIKDAGFTLGLQMMTGLPGDTPEKSIKTAKEIIRLGADNTRIYPALVIRGTELEELYHEGKYKPLSIDEAVASAASIYKLFESAGIKILRVGLHPSEGLLSGDDLVAGPFHISFRELVLTYLWWETLESKLKGVKGDKLTINVPPGQKNYVYGYNSENKNKLKIRFTKIAVIEDSSLKGRECFVDYCGS